MATEFAISGAGTTGNVVEGDLIGTAAPAAVGVDVATAIPNEVNGVVIENGASHNTIGGPTAAARDVISGNTGSGPGSNGVYIFGADTSNNVVQGDFIGTDSASGAALGNSGNGVLIAAGATGNVIGGVTAGARDIISGNTYSGVAVEGTGTTGNVIEGDFIGTTIDDGNSIANLFGVAITTGASGNTVGGTTAAAQDVIAGNVSIEVFLTSAGTSNNVVEGDIIGTFGAGTITNVAANYGVVINGGSSSNVIGGRRPGLATSSRAVSSTIR